MNKKNVGQNLRTFRRQAGYTQAQIAEEVGVTTDHISHVEIGSGTISLPLLLQICKLLEITPNDVLAGEYTPDPNAKESQSQQSKIISLRKINPDDGILLNYLYQFMQNRKS